MKKLKKVKIITISLLLILLCVVTFDKVDADTVKYKVCTPIKSSTYDKYTVYSSKYVTPYGYVNAYSNQDSRIVFCIEHGVPLINSGGRSFKSYKLVGTGEDPTKVTINKGVGYAGWYVDKNGKGSASCSNTRTAAQVFTHMLSYRVKKGSSCSTCDFLTISDSKLKSRVKSMLSTSSSSEETIANHVVQIRTLYNAHGKKLAFKSYKSGIPTNKFDSCDYNSSTGKYSCKKVLVETTGLLLKIQGLSNKDYRYKIVDKTSGVTVKREQGSNKITITATIDDGNIGKSVSYSYARTRLSNSSIVKKSIIGGRVQDMAIPVPKEYTEKTTVRLYANIDTGTINIKKTIANTGGKTLDGAKLYLYDDKDCTDRTLNYKGEKFAVRTTANGGLATWEGVIYENGITYYIGENETNDYEGLCVPVKPVRDNSVNEIANDSNVTIIENIPKGSGTIEINKTNDYTGKPLQGRLFGIYSDDVCETGAEDTEGNELEVKTSDANGVVSWSKVPYKTGASDESIYYVKEIFSNDSSTAGDGYAIDKTADIYKNAKDYCIPVTLKAKGEEFKKDVKKTLKIVNKPYGNITILKQDDRTGNSVKGAVFALYKSDGKTLAVDIDGKTVANATTDTSGVAKFENIPYGDYIIKEVSTPSGYKKLEKNVSFTLNDDTSSLKYQGQRMIGVSVEQKVTSYKVGDVDNDNKVTSKDLAIVKDWVEKINNSERVIISAVQKYAADVNKDGSLNDADVNLFESYVNNGNKLAFKALEQNVFILGDKTYNLGDPTNDGAVDLKDLEMAKKIYLGDDTEYTDVEYYACDLNNDGIVDFQDINLFEMYLGTGKIKETLEPQISIDLKKIDYNADSKHDKSDIYFLKGVIFASGGELTDYNYDLDGDEQITTSDITLLDSYISNINKEKAFDLSNMTEEQYLEVVDKISDYKDKDSSSIADYSNYDYNKDGKIDDVDLVSVKIDRHEYNVDYNGDGLIDSKDKGLLNDMINGIAKKDDASFIYDINGDQSVDDFDLSLYEAYVGGDKNLFEKVEITNDVNGDGKVDETDLKLVKNAVASGSYSKSVDVNNDGDIDNYDVISVKKAIGKFQEFNLLEQMVVSYDEKVSLVVTNVPIDITISKQDIANSKEVVGAKITITDEKGNKVIEYISDGNAKRFSLPVGTYTLVEKVAPVGYQKLQNTIKFKMGADGNVTLLSAKSSMYKVKKTKTYGELDHLVIYNTPKAIRVPNTGSVKSVLEFLGGVALVGAGGYFVYRRYKRA